MLRLDINLVFTIINLLIWYAIIRIFLFKPINKVIDKLVEEGKIEEFTANHVQSE